MGYYTYHTLSIIENNSGKTDKELIQELRENCEDAKISLNEDGEEEIQQKIS